MWLRTLEGFPGRLRLTMTAEMAPSVDPGGQVTRGKLTRY